MAPFKSTIAMAAEEIPKGNRTGAICLACLWEDTAPSIGQKSRALLSCFSL
jgi:hypothetical protein